MDDTIAVVSQKRIQTNDYVDNAEFLKALAEYKKLSELALNEGNPKPKVSNYIGSCFMKIANGIAQRPNFYSYTYKDEMILDGIENSILYVHNFNPDKSNNPFGYFSLVIWRAFLRRIEKEKKQQYVKYKSTENFGILGEEELEDLDDTILSQMQVYDNMYEFIDKFEKTMREKKNKISKTKGIESFID